MVKRLIQTMLIVMLLIEITLILLTMAYNYNSIELNIPFVGYLVSGRSEVVFELIHSTVNTSLLFWFVTKGLFAEFDGNSLSEAFERNGKIGLKAALISFCTVTLTSRIILGHYIITMEWLPWLILWVLNALYLDAYGPVFNPLSPQVLLYNWLTYSENDEPK